MRIQKKVIEKIYNDFSPKIKSRIGKAVNEIVRAKEKGEKVVAVLGSGPNLHEGVTTLVAELIHKGIIDGVSTSSAVISHEMAGTLEKVKRIPGRLLGLEADKLPSDGYLEVSLIPQTRWESIGGEIGLDNTLYQKMRRLKGETIIKAAGNIAYPTGLRTEKLAREILDLAKRYDLPFEYLAGYGADSLTMIGAGTVNGVPVLVSVPQLVGGGEVGLSIGDSISIKKRSLCLARMIDSASVIIESAVALTQEIHDGPFERFTGHGIWADWQGDWTYSLAGKKIIRLDLDANLEKVWSRQRRTGNVARAVQKGLPKTKILGVPFRMEMSGFARIPGSLPITADIGAVWPVLMVRVAEALKIKLDFLSYPQHLPEGQEVRQWIVKKVQPIDREKLFNFSKKLSMSYPK